MDLPELPRTIKKKEADFGVTFRHFIETNPPKEDCAFELKHTRGEPSLPFSELKDEQIAYANKIKKGAFIRIPGLKGEPDYVWMKGKPTYVVVKYPKNFYIIPMEAFVEEKEASVKRKSLTEERAKELSTYYI